MHLGLVGPRTDGVAIADHTGPGALEQRSKVTRLTTRVFTLTDLKVHSSLNETTSTTSRTLRKRAALMFDMAGRNPDVANVFTIGSSRAVL